MAASPKIAFARIATPEKGVAIVLAAAGGALSEGTRAADPGQALPRAFAAAQFSAKAGSSLELLAPAGSGLDRLVVLGLGEPGELSAYDWMKAGGNAAAALRSGTEATVIAQLPGRDVSAAEAASFAAGLLLRSYKFDKYKTRKDNGEDAPAKTAEKPAKVTIRCGDPAGARRAFAGELAAVEGALAARDLVNEPANALGPVEFAARAAELASLGLEVEVLTEKEMRKLGMGALLGVSQGAARPPRLVVLQWKGGKTKDKPLAFVGKGVVFDTGGNSMKSPGGMEDMKGDMGGAAAVFGLMQALAARKAKANVVGILGCVENMVDGNAQRPGDVVTSMSGQTIEVINTDAEGRLVLADALHYCIERFSPRFVVDLATLTGAIMVALGQHHAGLFSNDDELAGQIAAAGEATHERVWRMPLGPEYDKLIESKVADMKNTGGRYGGAISAAQFIKRFVKDTPWAHLDIAGTALAAPASEISQSWGSGYGVRLLDRLVHDNFEG